MYRTEYTIFWFGTGEIRCLLTPSLPLLPRFLSTFVSHCFLPPTVPVLALLRASSNPLTQVISVQSSSRDTSWGKQQEVPTPGRARARRERDPWVLSVRENSLHMDAG
jgi:hypothetical protein